MKKLIITTAISITLFGIHNVSANNTGKVNFTGNIVEAACKISSGNGEGVQNVALGTVRKNDLGSKSSRSKPIAFNIALKDCEYIQKAAVKFNATADKDDSNLLKLTEGDNAAEGVGIEIKYVPSEGEPTVVSIGSDTAISGDLGPDLSKNIVFPFTAAYAPSTDDYSKIKPGVANATATFEIVYK